MIIKSHMISKLTYTVNPEMLANIIFSDFVFLDFLATTNFNVLISNKINNEIIIKKKLVLTIINESDNTRFFKCFL